MKDADNFDKLQSINQSYIYYTDMYYRYFALLLKVLSIEIKGVRNAISNFIMDITLLKGIYIRTKVVHFIYKLCYLIE